jgi:carboxyl-terminal processing protease
MKSFLLIASFLMTCQASAQAPSTLTPRERVFIATRLYSAVTTYFAHWGPVSRDQFDRSYQAYVDQILGSDDRRAFDMASIALLAQLHNGHTWFSDRWLESQSGQALGFSAVPMGARWIVTSSALPGIQKGAEIANLNDIPIERFFAQSEKYLSVSDRRRVRQALFDAPVLFPERFDVAFVDTSRVTVDRKANKNSAAMDQTQGRWLAPRTTAYIRIPSFGGVKFVATALDYIHEFQGAKTMVIDVRGNPGGNASPISIHRALMNRPYREWIEESPSRSGIPSERGYEWAELSSGPATQRPEVHAFQGKVIILADSGCQSFCEDFVMPFKDSKRAIVVGEATAGTFSMTHYYEFDNGMRMNIASTRERFPDGAQFEGVGIAPDQEVLPTVEDLRSDVDRALQTALKLADR